MQRCKAAGYFSRGRETSPPSYRGPPLTAAHCNHNTIELLALEAAPPSGAASRQARRTRNLQTSKCPLGRQATSDSLSQSYKLIGE
eukprot:2148713-Amphidinium_carterae.1